MVQLSSSPILDVSPPNECSEEAQGIQGSPEMDSPQALSPVQLALSASTTTYQGYETYIEDGLICLKHKIRNIEKKKQKLDDYMKRLKSGEKLNQDQLEAVGKYEEVLHNLMFAKELQKTIGALTQDLLKAQRKAVRREQVLKMEVEKRRLRTVLHVHFILQTLQQEHVRKDFRSGLNGAPFLTAVELQHLLDLAALLGYKRNESMSLQDQMEQASIVYWDLLEGSNKPVAGSTYKRMKEQLSRLMDCGYFDHIPVPQNESLSKTETLVTKKTAESRNLPGSMSDLSTLMSEVPTREFLNRRYKPDSDLGGRGQPDKTQAPGHSWKAEFLALKQQEPPDSWDTEFPDRPVSPQPQPQPQPQPPTSKTSRGATGFVPKVQKTSKTPTAEPKQKRGQKLKGEPDRKMVVKAEAPVEVFDSPSSLPEDPVLRKRQLEDLMDQIQGSFSFMQDSVFDSEGSPINGRPQMSPPAAGSTAPVDAPAAQRELKSCPAHLQSKPLHSTPRLLPMDGKISLTNGEQPQDNSELDLAEDEVACVRELPQRSESEGYSSPPLYRRESAVSIGLTESVSDQTPVSQPVELSPCDGALSSASCQAPPFTSPPSSHSLNLSSTPFQAMHTVFKTNAPLPPRSDSDVKSDSSTFSDSYNLSYTTASTQTPPDVELQEQDQLPPVTTYQLESPVTNGCQVYLSPGQPAGNLSRPGQPYYARGSVRGGYESYRNTLRSPGGGYVHQSHTTRECAPVLYGIREYGYQLGYKRGAGTGGQRNNSRASWSNSSQVSSPERDNETFVSMDSGHGDSRCITPINVPMAAQDPALMPVHVYPLTQQMRVAFSAARTANFAPGSLDQTIIFDQLQSNLGETFDLHLGRFSCPVNGTYVFIFHILKLAVNVPLYVNLMKNEEVMVSAYANDGAPDHETASNHAVLQLYQGDQIWLRLHRGAIYGSSWKYSTFSGYLLYQD